MGAKATHDGAMIKMPRDITLCGHGNGEASECNADEYREAEKLLSAFQCGFEFRPRIPDVLYAQFLFLINSDAVFEILQRI